MAADKDHQRCTTIPEHCPHVREAADSAVKKVFAILGVDIDVPKEVEEFRENLRFGATMRRAADRGMLTLVGVLVTALLAVLWAGIVSKLGGGH